MKKILLFILISFFVSEMAYCQNKSIGWVQQYFNPSQALNAVYCINSDTVIAVGWGGLILRTINGGMQWDSINSGTSNELLYVNFINQSFGFAIGAKGTILKTNNSGISWTNIGINCNMMLFDLFFLNSDTLWVVGGETTSTIPIAPKGIILKSSNGGINWTIDSTFNAAISSIFFIDKDTGYIAANNGSTAIIRKTLNGGNSWDTVDISSGFNWYFSNIQFTSAKTGYINGFSEILKTNNYGLTWDSIFIAYPNSIRSFQIIDSCSFYYLEGVMNGSNVCLFDSCTNSIYSCLYSNGLLGIHFLNKNYGFAIGANAMIYKWGYYDGIDENKHNNYIMVSPNPFNDKVKLIIPCGYSNKEINISIYNSFGKQVFEINKIHDSNSSSIELEIPNYPQGIYFLVIKQKQDILQTIKLIKI
ncbi:MAG: T9SS type A sorting domain-containing protein [Bacteroidota bacterium]